MAAHSTLTGADLHEPKGADTATSGQVYVFDGAGSGTPTTIANNNLVIVTCNVVNISTAGSYWVVPGIAGDITTIYSVIDGAISGADCGLTFEINGTAITGSAITIANAGSAAGDVDTSSPSALNTITASDAVEIITDGASTGVTIATITFVIDVS
jgi:hypothetical protein